MYIETTATKKIKALRKRIRALQGGTSSSKTISSLLYLIALAQTDTTPTLTSVVAESIPHLKKGAMRDFQNIMKEHKYWDEDLWNATDRTYTFETGSRIEFFSVDNEGKARGPRRERLFVNECNNISYPIFDQLEIRTNEFIILDWNPSHEFWYYTELEGKRDDIDFLILTYKDNEGLPENIVKAIEAKKNNLNWWRVYGEGQLGMLESRIYKDWKIIDVIPHEARLVRYGLDFGYTNDPSAIIAIYEYNGGYILDEMAYDRGLSNKVIGDILLNLPKALIIADSAEPKSIDELRSYGLTVMPAEKGRDSILTGIQYVQGLRISVTSNSLNVIREHRNYNFLTDKNGKVINEPDHEFSHCFSPDTLVYTTKGKIKISDLVGEEGYLFSKDGSIQRFYDVKPTRTNTEMINLHMEDGQTISVTPDHLLLMPNGEWKEAGCFLPSDRIQSVNEQYYNTQWADIYKIQWLKILQRVCKWSKNLLPQVFMGNTQWNNTERVSNTPQRPQHREQYYREYGIVAQIKAFTKTFYGINRREQAEEKRMGGNYKTSCKEVAWVRRGEGVAQITWEESLRKTRTRYQRLLSLPQDIYYSTVSTISKILFSELQNEGKEKKVERITRGFCPIAYNLEVENTHCLMADGVIAHNSMDAIRYGINSLKFRQPDIIKVKKVKSYI